MRVVLVLLVATARAQDEPCLLEPFEEIDTVGGLADAALPAAASRQLQAYLAEPCDSTKRGHVMMSLSRKNLARAVGALAAAALRGLPAEAAARFFALLPGEAQRWMLTSFETALQTCAATAGRGGTFCASAEEAEALRALRARAQRAHARATLLSEGEDVASVERVMAEDSGDNAAAKREPAADEAEATRRNAVKYAARIGLEADTSEWLVASTTAAAAAGALAEAEVAPSSAAEESSFAILRWLADVENACSNVCEQLHQKSDAKNGNEELTWPLEAHVRPSRILVCTADCHARLITEKWRIETGQTGGASESAT